MAKIHRDLPNNEYLAAVNANAPTNLNPYATIADLAGFVAGNLYTINGAIPAATARAVTIAANSSITFSGGVTKRTYNVAGVTITEGSGLSPSGFGETGTASYITQGNRWAYKSVYNFGTELYVDDSVNDTVKGDTTRLFFGTDFGTATASTYGQLSWYKGAVQNGFAVNELGERILSQSAGLTRLSSLNVASGMAFLSGSGGTGYVGVVDQTGFASWIGSALDNNIYANNGTIAAATARVVTMGAGASLAFNGGDVMVGTTAASGRFAVRGADNSNLTRMFTFENLSGIDKFSMNNNGNMGSAAGTTAIISNAIGHWHRTSGLAIGMEIEATSAATAALYILANGVTTNGIFLPMSSTKTGTVTGGLFDNKSTGGSNHRGVYGFARNGSSFDNGIEGSVGGGESTSPVGEGVAIFGHSQYSTDVNQRGGKLTSSFNNVATVYTKDAIGLIASAFTVNGNAASTATGIAAQFFTSGLVGSGLNMAINVPAIGPINNGNVVFGAPASSANKTMVEVTGSLEIIGSVNGVIWESPDASRYKVTMLNGGVLDVNAA